MKFKLIVCLYFFTLTNIYTQEFISINKTENIPTKSYYEKNGSYTTNDDEFEIYISSYHLNYKIWTLYGEPVFDFKLKWDSPSLDRLSQLKNIPHWFYNNVGENLPIVLDVDLIQKMKKIKPLSFKFIFQMYSENDYKMGILSQQSLDEDHFLSLYKYKIFNIDVINESGKFSQFSVPGSPEWEDLHPGYLEVIKNTNDIADLYIDNIRLLEVEWPQYDIESILVEQINRNNKIKQIKEEVSNNDDFWDTPPPNLSRKELPLVKVKSRKDVIESKREIQDEQNKVKSLSNVGNLVILSYATRENKATIKVNPILKPYTIIAKNTSGNEIWRKENTYSPDIVLSDINSDIKVEFFKNNIFQGYIKVEKKEIPKYFTGDTGPAGGIVFYDKGNFSNGWRYLEAAPSDLSLTFSWGTFNHNVSGANNTVIGSGHQNTLDIISGDDSTTNAANACFNYSIAYKKNIYDDWFLPSKGELDAMYDLLYKNGLGSFETVWTYYWSSSEKSNERAYCKDFDNGEYYAGANKNRDYYVRPIRAF